MSVIILLTVVAVLILCAAFGLHCFLCACDEKHAQQKGRP